jgi:hypothetical protein
LFVEQRVSSAAPKRKKRAVYRKTNEREGLDEAIVKWVRSAFENDPLRGTRAIYDILTYSQRLKLVCAPPESVRTPEAVTALLEESEEWEREWAAPLCQVVRDYDSGLKTSATVQKESTKVVKKARKAL